MPVRTRFVLDVHLEKLARHLRMVGVDAVLPEDAESTEDSKLLAIAQEEGRVLLTRDRALHDRGPAELRYYVQGTDPREQLREVAERFALWDFIRSHKGFLTRCLQCNTMILPVKATLLADRVPTHVREEHSEFFLCPRCERVYWNGSHVERMKKWIDGL